MAANPIEEAVIARLRELPPQKQQEVLEYLTKLESAPKGPCKSLYGLLAGKGINISEEDIAEARKETWAISRESTFSNECRGGGYPHYSVVLERGSSTLGSG